MASGPRFYMPKAVALDAVGVTVPGALLNFYLTGSTTRAATYSNQSLTVANSNPVVADSSGTFPDIFLDPTLTYKVVFTGPDDGITPPLEFWTADPVDEAWNPVDSGFAYLYFSFLTGSPPASQQTIAAYTAPFKQRIFGDFDGTASGFVSATGNTYGNPGTPYTINVYVNSILLPFVGQITISGTGAFTFSTVAGLPIDLDADDYLLFVAPVTTDTFIYNISFTIPIEFLAFVNTGVGSGAGDVNGPGASVVGHFALWANSIGTLLSDGGTPGSLAFLNSITHASVSDWASAILAQLTADLVAGANTTITPVGSTLVIASTGGGGGGGNVTGAASSVNGEMVLYSGTTGKILANSGCVPSANALTFLAAANFAAMRTALGLGSLAVLNDVSTKIAAGSNVTITGPVAGVMTINASLAGGAVTSSAGSAINGELVLFNGTSGTNIGNSACVPSANALTFLAAANFAAMRTALGLGTAATQNTGTSGANVPLLNGANTWSTTQTFTLAPVFTDQSGSRTALGLGALAILNTITASLISDPLNVKTLESLEVAFSDETTALTTGTSKVTFWMPYAFTATEVFIANGTPSSSGAVTTNLKQNGSTVFSTPPSIGSGQNTSLTGTGSVPAVLSVTSYAKGDKMTVDITAAGTGATGGKLMLIGHRT